MADPRRQAGFTLIEIIVVLAILGLMAGLVLSRGPQRSGAVDMRRAAATVAGALRGARGRAIAINRTVAVRFDPNGTTLQVGDEARRPLPKGIAAAAATPPILFRPDGSSSGGTVELEGEAQRARIVVDWLTGRVSVTDARTPSK